MTPELKKAFALIEKQTVTLDDAANFLGNGRIGVRELIKEKKIEAYLIGTEWRIVSKSLDAYAKSLIAKVG